MEGLAWSDTINIPCSLGIWQQVVWRIFFLGFAMELMLFHIGLASVFPSMAGNSLAKIQKCEIPFLA